MRLLGWLPTRLAARLETSTSCSATDRERLESDDV